MCDGGIENLFDDVAGHERAGGVVNGYERRRRRGQGRPDGILPPGTAGRDPRLLAGLPVSVGGLGSSSAGFSSQVAMAAAARFAGDLIPEAADS